jgi:hypothetical protein
LNILINKNVEEIDLEVLEIVKRTWKKDIRFNFEEFKGDLKGFYRFLDNWNFPNLVEFRVEKCPNFSENGLN